MACERVCCGTGAGAWPVHPQGLGPSSIVYSFGAGSDLSFDRDVRQRWGAAVHGFHGAGEALIGRSAPGPDRTPPAGRRLAAVVRELGHNRIDLLRIDLGEGALEVIADLVRCVVPIRQVLVDFRGGGAKVPLGRVVTCLATLRAHGFRIFALGPGPDAFALLHVSESASGRWPVTPS